MNKKIIGLSILIIVLVGICIYLYTKPKPEVVAPEITPTTDLIAQKKTGPCPGTTLKHKMKDDYMKGIIEKDQPFEVIMNWFACNPLKSDDLVYYVYSNSAEPIVRKVVAVPGDRFQIIKDTLNRGWALKVNGELYQVNNDAYYFGVPGNTPALKLYEDQNKGHLKSGDMIIFSNNPPGYYDSGLLGAVSVLDVLGIVKSETQPSFQKQKSGKTKSDK